METFKKEALMAEGMRLFLRHLTISEPSEENQEKIKGVQEILFNMDFSLDKPLRQPTLAEWYEWHGDKLKTTRGINMVRLLLDWKGKGDVPLDKLSWKRLRMVRNFGDKVEADLKQALSDSGFSIKEGV